MGHGVSLPSMTERLSGVRAPIATRLNTAQHVDDDLCVSSTFIMDAADSRTRNKIILDSAEAKNRS